MKKILQKVLPKAIGAKINFTSLYSPKSAARQAFTIFSTPRSGRVQEEQRALLDAAKFKIFDLKERQIQTYHWPGEGKKILLAHGWESNTYRWYLLLPELQKAGYDIYALDAPAQGYSTGTTFTVVLYAEAIEKVCQEIQPDLIVGHSMGALATLYHQSQYQKNTIEAIVLLGSASELSAIMDDYQKLLGLNKLTMRALEQLLMDRYGFTFKEFSGAAFAKAVSKPALIIHDKLDRITPVSSSQNIHKNLKGSTYIETEGYGHSLHQESVRDHIIKFLKELEV